MKKYLFVLMAIVLVVSLGGCKQDNKQGTDMTTEVTTETSTEEASSEEKSVEVYLKDVYGAHNIKVGTCLSPQMVDDPELSKLITEQFNSVTMENAMKPDYIFNKEKSIEAGDLVVEFNSDAIKMLDFAKANNLAVRGHTLVWYSQTPDWIFYEDFDTSKDFVSRDVMLARMESFIRQVFEKLDEMGYLDLFYAYDVVNEAWMEDGSMRSNNWSTIIGEDYLWYSFYFANKYAPESVDLYYNDYNEQYKAGALVRFVETLVDEDGNYLIDGIGLQAHLYTFDNVFSYFKAVDKLAGTGLKIEVTELDVSLGSWQNTLDATDENLKAQGKFYYDLIKGFIDRADAGTINIDAITFWGFEDSLSWRSEASPLLYDKDCNPKYAYYGAAQVKELSGYE